MKPGTCVFQYLLIWITFVHRIQLFNNIEHPVLVNTQSWDLFGSL
jgi:hypothetical protein